MEKTVVLIHGYGFDYRTWYPVELGFDGYKIIYLSLPGFGVDEPTEGYSIASLARMFWSSIDETGHQEVHLAGHSMGGYVCLEMAAQQPNRVGSLALIHSHVFADAPEKQKQRTATMDQIKQHGRAGVVRKMIPSLFAPDFGATGIIMALVNRGLAYSDRAWSFGAGALRDRSDHTETLKNIRVPVLMIAGEKDAAVPMDWVLQQASLPECNILHVYPGVGHMAMYENTSRTICDLADFYAAFL